jgi:uncharacterized protein YdeI (BOF family)
MKLKFQTQSFLFFIFLIVLFNACATSIRQVYKKQDKLQGKKVVVRGTVVSSLELSDLYCFTVRDKSGKILIVTENLLPIKNDKVRIKGILEKNFVYKNQNMVIIKEKKLKGTEPEDSKKKIHKL